ncbi:MAG: deoxyguanosinetriphosphate triphosphohydrolase [Oscillospiraceae bacterium]|nr:deoxyguanosinetriphosphate triphosphohydrolase [Oscillospiraceae bacterium]
MEETTIRERLEAEELQRLAPQAAMSARSRGRVRPERAPSDVRTCFQRDTDRILHSKSFRRLMHKTQVFLKPEGDHYRTRMTHTLEVARIARTIARGLRLNEDLTEAQALGHDLGHTPFGHAGEVALTDVMGQSFYHNEQSLRVVDRLEKGGEGLNLTYETRMGIRGHTGPHVPATWEGQVVRLSDRIAYVNHDVDDAIRGGILRSADLPQSVTAVLGESHKERINTLVENMIYTTRELGRVALSPPVQGAMDELRAFLFERVYRNPVAKGEESKAKIIIQQLYRYYIAHPERLPADFCPQLDFDGIPRVVCDYIAGMTDNYAVFKYSEIFIPQGWQIR